jgi:hypothetical protein
MRRWLINLAALVSLLFCIASAAMWVRSRVRADFLSYDSPFDNALRQTGHRLNSARGLLCYTHCDIRATAAPAGVGSRQQPPGFVFSSGPTPPHVDSYDRVEFWGRHRAGFGYHRMAGSYGFGAASVDTSYVMKQAVAPYWALVLLSAIGPAQWFVINRYRRARRRQMGLCVRCGYDLRATPGQCPECGTVSQGTSAPPHNQPTMNPALGQGAFGARAVPGTAARRRVRFH